MPQTTYLRQTETISLRRCGRPEFLAITQAVSWAILVFVCAALPLQRSFLLEDVFFHFFKFLRGIDRLWVSPDVFE